MTRKVHDEIIKVPSTMDFGGTPDSVIDYIAQLNMKICKLETALIAALAQAPRVEEVWHDISEWHDDDSDCLFAFFFEGDLISVEWTSPLSSDFNDFCDRDAVIFKRVSMKTDEVEKLIKITTGDGEKR